MRHSLEEILDIMDEDFFTEFSRVGILDGKTSFTISRMGVDFHVGDFGANYLGEGSWDIIFKNSSDIKPEVELLEVVLFDSVFSVYSPEIQIYVIVAIHDNTKSLTPELSFILDNPLRKHPIRLTSYRVKP